MTHLHSALVMGLARINDHDISNSRAVRHGRNWLERKFDMPIDACWSLLDNADE
jgi:hypothetical protein